MAKAPGKSHRKGMTLVEAVRVFSNEATATQWFINTRWPNGVRCAHCESDRITERPNGKPQPYHCGSCRRYFSVKTHTVMQSSKLPLSTWALAFYIVSTGLKGTSSMKMHRDLGVTQKTAWHLAHRIRETWADQVLASFSGPVEMDEAYFGGKAKNMHAADRKRRITGRGGVDKTVVAGMKDRETNQISAAVVETTRKHELQAVATSRIAQESDVFTDDLKSYEGLPNHGVVNHSVGEYVRGKAHVNGMESFWSMLKRGYYGTYHRMSPAHLQRYVAEFAGRHNIRSMDTMEQMASMVLGTLGKRLRYKELTGRA